MTIRNDLEEVDLDSDTQHVGIAKLGKETVAGRYGMRGDGSVQKGTTEGRWNFERKKIFLWAQAPHLTFSILSAIMISSRTNKTSEIWVWWFRVSGFGRPMSHSTRSASEQRWGGFLCFVRKIVLF